MIIIVGEVFRENLQGDLATQSYRPSQYKRAPFRPTPIGDSMRYRPPFVPQRPVFLGRQAFRRQLKERSGNEIFVICTCEAMSDSTSRRRSSSRTFALSRNAASFAGLDVQVRVVQRADSAVYVPWIILVEMVNRLSRK
jgi:hypothetical protein